MGRPSKYHIPWPKRDSEGKNTQEYGRCVALIRGGVPLDEAVAQVRREKEEGQLGRKKKSDSAIPAKTPGKGSKKREDGGKGGRKPDLLKKKPAPVKRNGDGAIAVSGEDLLRDPRVPDSVKDQIRTASGDAQSDKTGKSASPSSTGTVQVQDDRDKSSGGLQGSSRKNDTDVSKIDRVSGQVVTVDLAPLEKALSNIAVCLSEICDKLDTANRNLAKGRP